MDRRCKSKISIASAGQGWVRIETNGVEHIEPVYGPLETYLDEYLAEAEIADDPAGPLFRTSEATRLGRLGITPRHVSVVIRGARYRASACDPGTLKLMS